MMKSLNSWFDQLQQLKNAPTEKKEEEKNRHEWRSEKT